MLSRPPPPALPAPPLVSYWDGRSSTRQGGRTMLPSMVGVAGRSSRQVGKTLIFLEWRGLYGKARERTPQLATTTGTTPGTTTKPPLQLPLAQPPAKTKNIYELLRGGNRFPDQMCSCHANASVRNPKHTKHAQTSVSTSIHQATPCQTKHP